MKFKINLSYNPIEGDKIANTLARYKDRHHSEIIRDFEDQIKTFTGTKYAVALNTGTAALHLALKALGVTTGDHVLVSTFTYVASVNPILYQGAIPVFIDSERDTWNMDPALMKQAIEELIREQKRPKAIMLVHTYGVPAKLDEIMEIAAHYNIPVIEDAAEAIGSYYNGKHVGSFGALGTLSFNVNKIITTYGGGAVLTNNLEDYKRILFWATQSREELPYYEHREVGYNYRMSPVNAAVGLSEWSDIEIKLKERKIVFDHYRDALQGNPDFQFPEERKSARSNHWFTTVIIMRNHHAVNYTGSREIMEKLGSCGIEARLMWNPMHRQPAFKRYRSFLNGTSNQLFESGLCLPSDRNALQHHAEIIHAIRKS